MAVSGWPIILQNDLGLIEIVGNSLGRIELGRNNL